MSPDNPATKLEQSTKRSICTKPHVMWIALSPRNDVYLGLHVEDMASRYVGGFFFLLKYWYFDAF